MKFKIFGGGASAVLTFADNFHRTDQPSMLGDAWICAPGAGSTIVGGSNLAASINVAGGSQATFSICSSNGANVIYCWPIPLTWNILNALQQEAQCRYISDNSGGVNGAFNGPFVLGNVNKDSCYFIETNANAAGSLVVGDWIVVARKGGVHTTLAGPFTFALNDTLRIEGIPSATGTTVNAYKNGVRQSSTVDSAAGFLSTGVCGFFDFFVSTTITQGIDNFTCGNF